MSIRASENSTNVLPRAGEWMPPATAPQLTVVVDTEEEFNWDAPLSRDSTSVTAMRHIHRVQRIFDRAGLTPTYVIDYPVASKPEGYGPLFEIWRDGRCDIGAHLHPWVTPPHTEEVNGRNSFTLNLPEPLQRAKLERLCEEIDKRFGAPHVFKAGRYGIGAATLPILEGLGFNADVSVCPRFDFSALGGPSFTDIGPEPWRLTARLLEVPCTVGYVGWARSVGSFVLPLTTRPLLSKFRAAGVLARTRAMNRIMLSPEGSTLAELCALTRALVVDGCRVFTLSFHSPSVEPGHTPYVRTAADLERFLTTIDEYCHFFKSEMAGRFTTAAALAAASTA